MAQVYLVPDEDPEMQLAIEQARATFRYFWRELAWERRRIIPGLSLAAIKYAMRNRVYGAYTVNLIRSRMGRAERSQHDEAWGLDFGDPNKIEVVPPELLGKKPKGGFLQKLFGGGGSPEPLDLETIEHPMAVHMAESFVEFLDEDPANIHSKDDRGWTFLHQQALAGTTIGVSVLLERGADQNAVTDHGMTPLQLAKSLGWNRVADVLTAHGAQ